ncbi:ADP-ribosylglycohydrolase family protein [Anabaenopsis elenkinii]|jgi:ADP-ribosylglycohydrolase|uniref:ADP-ribosylglycohydrolase family protein n=1 Tax=Anabaenopsis elenkinii CCIBt3563 TaxID=2779889 RepID=A0A7U3NM57_9CYAN|nr:ADP-ribosylglycohydrolase family protein [Anabaenopsis elenkinii]QOV21434.1 ADP-ribosylglycohydrolase family protein [Anabaenopsis elenkinii CCIBt3563]
MQEKNQSLSIDSLVDRCAGSITAAAAGDALGWMTEFIRSHDDLKRKMGVDQVTEYQSWSKRVGGRFQGYEDYIIAGEYSDDTQLTICSAACISSNGCFDYHTFCKFEYPMWLEYARGAGGTVKEAADKIQRKSADWNSNFFSRKIKDRTIDYRDGAANGAAMRISPHVLANGGRWEQAEADIWRNSIISHGHPRAIIGAILYGYALYTVLQLSECIVGQQLIEILGHWVKQLAIPKIAALKTWEAEWNKGRVESFEAVFEQTKQEAVEKLRLVWLGLRNDELPQSILKQLGCFEQATKGSGLATAIAGIYLFARHPEQTQQNIITAANMIGSDTDSIAAFVGGLGGAAFGLKAIPEKWRSQIQDAPFLICIGEYLAKISAGEHDKMKIRPGHNGIKLGKALSRQEVHSDMRVVHHRLGAGTITEVDKQSLLTQGRTVTIVRINFDIGQSCKLAFRGDTPSETLFIL